MLGAYNWGDVYVGDYNWGDEYFHLLLLVFQNFTK